MYARMSAFVLVLTLAVSGSVSAQETTGTVAGRIVDSQGLAVPGVAVTLTGSQGVKTVVTDADGRFAIPFLTPGAYTIRAELQGFKTAETKDLVVSIGQSTSADLTLEVGGLTDTVQVVATTVPIDVTSTTVGLVMSTDTLRNFPVGRTFAQTLYLTPGVSSSARLAQPTRRSLVARASKTCTSWTAPT